MFEVYEPGKPRKRKSDHSDSSVHDPKWEYGLYDVLHDPIPVPDPITGLTLAYWINRSKNDARLIPGRFLGEAFD